MSAAFVIDASIAMAWCFVDETTVATEIVQDRLKQEAAIVPSHWFLEVANSLAMAERRNRITATNSEKFISLLGLMTLEIDEELAGREFSQILPLSRALRLTCYDATYLDLSLRTRLPLATLDNELRVAAKTLGVQLLGK